MARWVPSLSPAANEGLGLALLVATTYLARRLGCLPDVERLLALRGDRGRKGSRAGPGQG